MYPPLTSRIFARVLHPGTSRAANVSSVGGRSGGTSLLRTGSQSGRLRQLLGLTETDQTPAFRGTQYPKLVLHRISQRLLPQLRPPWTELPKKDQAGPAHLAH